MTTDLFFHLLIIHFVATMSPGPNFVLVFNNAVSTSRLVRLLPLIAGISAGILVHAVVAEVGLSRLIKSVPELMVSIKILGAAYMFYLGSKSLIFVWNEYRKKKEEAVERSTNPDESVKMPGLKTGFLACIVNPKAFFYLSSVIPQALGDGDPGPLGMALPLAFFLVTFFWFVSVSMAIILTPVRAYLKEFRMVVASSTGVVLCGYSAVFVLDIFNGTTGPL